MILCVVYVSSSSSADALMKIAKSQLSKLVHSFSDATYNRTSYFFMDKIENGNLKNSVLNFCSAAYKTIDFSKHQGTHPTLGTCDHLCFSPLGNTSIENAKLIAADIAIEYQNQFNVPVYKYGAISENNARLRDIRKSLGYFTSNNPLKDDTSINCDKTKGVTCMGVVPFVLNFNIQFSATSLREKVTQVTAYLRCPEVGRVVGTLLDEYLLQSLKS